MGVGTEIGDLVSLGSGEEEGGGVGKVSSALITIATGDSERAFFFFIERSSGFVLRFSGSMSDSESAEKQIEN